MDDKEKLQILNDILIELNYRRLDDLEILSDDHKKMLAILERLEKQLLALFSSSVQDTLTFREYLTYGTCMRFKGNPEHNKFKYWYVIYNEAIKTMNEVTKNDR